MKYGLNTDNLEGIAVIGMSGRFPGAANLEAFWENLKNGTESITYFSKEEAKACGVSEELLDDPNYVFAAGVIDDIEMFDADFFGINPREADGMDPQQRLFLECCYEALENGGYACNDYPMPVGVYAGSNMSYYFLHHLFYRMSVKDDFSAVLSNDKDYIATRVSYQFNFKGPSVNVQTACSTGMTAIAIACDSLLDYHCDMVLAGGTGLHLPQKAGYLYQDGFIGSPDGHTRPFDDDGHGTVFTSTVGVVLMKRLEDAVRDGDHIYAVIKGVAVNNDGSDKIGFTAPGREGQADVVAAAQGMAGISAEDVSYIETHGTGTALGDPIEVSALEKVFAKSTDRKMFCALGSLKSNLGHAISGSGVGGMLKTVLALDHKQIPPTINFSVPNRQIDFINSPFYLNTRLSEWESDGKPRIAGVSSFGFGGTNVHAVLEEAPVLRSSAPSQPFSLLVLSAKTPTALDTMCKNLAEFLLKNPQTCLADAAYTLQVGRTEFPSRRAIVCQNISDAVQKLSQESGEGIFSGTAKENPALKNEAKKLLESGEVPAQTLFGGLADLWVRGAKIPWESLYEKEERLRIPLPTYPFERKKHWIEQFDLSSLSADRPKTKSADGKDWLYHPTWEKLPSVPFCPSELDKDGGWLIFEDESGFMGRVASYLKEQGCEVLSVKTGEGFSANEAGFTILPNHKEDYEALAELIFAGEKPVKTILHGWSIFENTHADRLVFAKECLERGFFSLLYLAQVLGGYEEKVRIAAVSSRMHQIGEEESCPEKIPLMGLCRVIPKEYGNLSCQSLDILPAKPNSIPETKQIEAILSEVTSKTPAFIAALRNGARFAQRMEPLVLEEGEGGLAEENGVYLITGGTGGIGLCLAEYMASRAPVKLILTQRSAFPPKEAWNQWLEAHSEEKGADTIRRLLALEKNSTQVLVLQADVTDREAMKKAVLQAEKAFGKITGLIHAAGIADNKPVSEKDAASAQAVFAPKIFGTLVLNEIFSEKPLLYRVFFSSSSAILGNAGFCDYCGANAFLDGFAQVLSGTAEGYTVSVNWDEWAQVGMAANGAAPDRVRDKIPLQTGLVLLDRIVTAKPAAQVAVSPGDFSGMLSNIEKFLRASLLGEGASVLPAESNRPEMQTPYEAPSSPAEKEIAGIWESLLGVHPIGVNDDFFELGGHSLLATSIAAELAKRFRRHVSLQSLFDHSTVAQLAKIYGVEDEENYEEGSL